MMAMLVAAVGDARSHDSKVCAGRCPAHTRSGLPLSEMLGHVMQSEVQGDAQHTGGQGCDCRTCSVMSSTGKCRAMPSQQTDRLAARDRSVAQKTDESSDLGRTGQCERAEFLQEFHDAAQQVSAGR